MAVPIASDTKLWEKFVMNRGWTWGGFDGKHLVASVTRLGDVWKVFLPNFLSQVEEIIIDFWAILNNIPLK